MRPSNEGLQVQHPNYQKFLAPIRQEVLVWKNSQYGDFAWVFAYAYCPWSQTERIDYSQSQRASPIPYFVMVEVSDHDVQRTKLDEMKKTWHGTGQWTTSLSDFEWRIDAWILTLNVSCIWFMGVTMMPFAC